MEVLLPGFNPAIVWGVLFIEVAVAVAVSVMLRVTTNLRWPDIIKGASVFLAVAFVIAGIALWLIAGVYDEQVRIAALQSLGFSYVEVDGRLWLGVKDDVLHGGIIFQTSPGEVWTIKQMPVQ